MKNYYISKEEFEGVMKRIKPKHSDLKEICYLIFEKGYRVGEAMKTINPNKTSRSYTIMLRRLSKGLFTFLDLRKGYLMNNPHILIKRLGKKQQRQVIPARLRWTI